MSRIAITSKTRMAGGCCVGAFDIDTRRYLRLLQANGANQPSNCPYEIGQYWEMQYTSRTNLVPPHVEDVLVASLGRSSVIDGFTGFLLENVPFYQGGMDGLFQGLVRFTNSGGAYISHEAGVPEYSVGFWTPPVNLTLQENNGKFRYGTPLGFRSLPYVGFAEPIQIISRGMLVRVSLARWWSPSDDFEPRCYVQLSGWYS